MTIDPFVPASIHARMLLPEFGFGRPGPWIVVALLLGFMVSHSPAGMAEEASASRFSETVRPILEQYCYGCHGMGSKKGGVSLDTFDDDEAAVDAPEFWHGVLKNVRAGIMPPPGKPKPSADEVKGLGDWIKRDAFRADPNDPDPGRVTLRRLNRVEYRNTIRDLMGIDFRTDEEFPADDSGYGFDNIGDVLTISPLLLEKYVQAAESIVAKAVPTVSEAVPVRVLTGSEFRGDKGARGERMTFYKEAKVSQTFKARHAGTYRLTVEIEVDGNFDPEPGKCRFRFAADRSRVDRARNSSGTTTRRSSTSLPRPGRPATIALTFDLTPLIPAGPEAHQAGHDGAHRHGHGADGTRALGAAEKLGPLLLAGRPRHPGGAPRSMRARSCGNLPRRRSAAPSTSGRSIA